MDLDSADNVAKLMDIAQISILGLTDARIPWSRSESLKRQFHHSLPAGTAVITFCTDRPNSTSTRNTTMGGQIFLIHKQWEKWVGHHRTDPSGLALAVSIRITYNKTALTIIQVMVPPKSGGPYTMWVRLQKYLTKTNNTARPDEYVLQTAERWAVAERLAGRAVVIMGDFNKSIEALATWEQENDMYSMSTELAMAMTCGYRFASFNGTSTVKPSHIDHIFIQRGSRIRPNSVGGTTQPTLLTDHP